MMLLLTFPSGSAGTHGAGVGGGNGGNTAFTSSSVTYGPNGGFGQASAFPGGPDGLGVRIAAVPAVRVASTEKRLRTKLQLSERTTMEK
ncbi:hypothetical protein Phum_PHUM578790 [Pediculus humanus corporis]|uniref:Uncharacterized protein n=1 Tax=Pediculus humanus subsp. corporis TaxID=121224 RepID=E0W1L3_PEDHC|nr:uncharacterized protein Phum_PHUM578790 [Pediculus humanus corporis]EEB19519.1 hypothetical protein Phum_PHUM578790 [Pediculus humanus corporis]